MQLLEVWCV